MKHFYYSQFIAAIFISISIAACNNEMPISELEVDVNNMQSRSFNIHENIDTIKFMYQGNSYSSAYTLIDDSVIDVKDPSIDSLLTHLNSLPNLFTFSYPNGTCEYFNDKVEFMSNLNRVLKFNREMALDSKTNQPAPRKMVDNNPSYAANLFLYDDDNYTGKLREIHLRYGQSDTICNHLKPIYAMNDKTTSFIAYANGTEVLFELYEDDHLKSHCFSFIPPLGSTTTINNEVRSISPKILVGKVFAPNLKNVHVKNTKKSRWNDRITSLKITQL